ncbi:hypothetical protein [Nocardioides ultimimeridianus]
MAAGLITPEQLARALARQAREGGYVGEHLIADGAISSADFHEALAEAWELNRRDLLAEPPAAELLAELDVEEAAELGWLACEVTDDKTVVVASCVRPDALVVAEVLDRFPNLDVEFMACSRAEIDTVALGERRRRIGSRTRATAEPRVWPFHAALAAAGAAMSLAAAVLMPVRPLVAVVLVGCLAFVLGGAAQWTGGFVSLVMAEQRERRPGPAAAGDPDAPDDQDGTLPLYSVIVRVAGGAAGLEEMFGNFRQIDYPRDRVDAILVVAEGDHAMREELRTRPPRGWLRVAKVSDGDFLDVVRACDHALALARGRYVVAYDQDERPAPDQLRRAVEAFEADLVARIDGRAYGAPLVGLRVGERTGPGGRTVLDLLAAVDQVLPVDSAWADRPGPVRSSDVTSVHFNTNLLRRRGGFGLLVHGTQARDPGVRPPRIEVLDSHSQRGASPTTRGWLHARAERLAQVMVEAGHPRRTDAATRRLGAVVMFLAYPVVLGGALVESVRGRTLDASGAAPVAWVALAMTAMLLSAFVIIVAALMLQHRGWRVALGALALPAHWLLHAAAAWIAVWALLVPRRVRRTP